MKDTHHKYSSLNTFFFAYAFFLYLSTKLQASSYDLTNRQHPNKITVLNSCNAVSETDQSIGQTHFFLAGKQQTRDGNKIFIAMQ